MSDTPKKIYIDSIVKKETLDNTIYEKMSIDDGLEHCLIIVLRSLAWVDKQILAENPNRTNIAVLKDLQTMLNDLKKEERQSEKEMDTSDL